VQGVEVVSMRIGTVAMLESDDIGIIRHGNPA
jgi:hypothetical protein